VTQTVASERIGLGLRGRLLLAFAAITLFVVIATGVGLYVFAEVRKSLDRITETALPPALAAGELSAKAEFIVSAGPALLAAGASEEVGKVSGSVFEELASAESILEQLRRGGGGPRELGSIGDALSKLRANLGLLQSTTLEKIALESTRKGLISDTFTAYREFDRVWEPRYADLRGRVMRMQRVIISPSQSQQDRRAEINNLDQAILALLPLEQVRRDSSATVEVILRASVTSDPPELAELRSQALRLIRSIDGLVSDIDPDVSRELFRPIARIRADVRDATNIFSIRQRELDTIAQSKKLIAENTALSATLHEAMEQLVARSREEIDAADQAAKRTQRISTNVLIAVAVLAIISSLLIVWLYVGRSLVARLTRLSQAMLALAGGRRDVRVAATGNDEVAAMARAVEVFRQNAVALDELLAEREETAARLETIVEDRTRESERRRSVLRVTFENMGHGALVFDRELSLTAWNDQVRDLLELPDEILNEGTTFPAFIRFLAQRGEFGSGDVEQQVQTRTSSGPYHVAERIRANGTVLEVRRNPLPGGGFVSIYTDITERKRREQELELARDAATEARRTTEAAYRELEAAQANLIHSEKMASLGQLTAGIAHEIKNPLNFVNNFADVSAELTEELREVLAPAAASFEPELRSEITELLETLKANLGKVAQHGRRADSIVKNMLLHSREDSGEKRSVDLNATVEESINLAYHGTRAEKRDFNITLTKDLDPKVGSVAIYPQEFMRVLLNIVSNGCYAAHMRKTKHTDATFEPTLAVSTKALNDRVEIRVRDNGVGIPDDIKAKIFNPFFTTKPAGEGTGLGLSLSYDIIVKQHGGTIDVATKAGSFTEFRITLPRDGVAGAPSGAKP
jgi:signal transduction histidine kinase